MKVKVCGLRHIDNILSLHEAGVSMMGFIFYDKSKRFIKNSKRSELFSQVPNSIERVGVFVNSDLHEVIEIIKNYKLDYVQLHGDENNEFCREVGTYTKVIKAFRVDNQFDFEKVKSYVDVDLFLFDAKGKEYGGNGIQYDWSILHNYTYKTPFLLSGGIGPEDVESIIAFQHKSLYGIDVNSGFEIEPGLKDAIKVKSFINKL